MGFGTVLQRTCIGFTTFSDGHAPNGIFHSSLFVYHAFLFTYTPKLKKKQGQKATFFIIFFNNEFNEFKRIFASQFP